MKIIMLLILALAFVPMLGAGLHEYQPPKTMLLFFRHTTIRSQFHFLWSLIKTRFLRRIPVPFGMTVETDTEEIKKLVEAQSKAFEGIKTNLTDLEAAIKAKASTAELGAQLEQRLKDFGKLADDARTAEKAAMTKRMDELEIKLKGGQFGGAQRQETPGELFAKADAIKNYQGGDSPRVVVKTFGRKDLTEAYGSGGQAVIPLILPGIVQPRPNQLLRIRDLLTVTPISTPVLMYVRQLFFGSDSGSSGQTDGNAQTVVEATKKPKSDMRFEMAQAVASTIATWLPASRQIISDVPVLTGFINQQLIYSVLLEEEKQILYGSGMAPDLDGITLNAGVFTPNSGETIIDSLRRMIAQVLKARFPATGFVLNPQDWTEVELTKDTMKRYIIGDPNAVLGSRIWGLPVVQSESMQLGEALCGAFGMGATLYDREEANIRISEHHAEMFIENMVAILAEERILLPIFRPLAFAYGCLLASS